MGNAQGRHKSSHDSYRTEQTSCSNDNKQFPNEVKEFPRVLGTGSVASVDCIKGTSVCISGGSEGVCYVLIVH